MDSKFLKTLLLALLVLPFLFIENVSAMTFSNPKELGNIILSPPGWFEVEGAISNIGQPYTNQKFIKSYNFKKGQIPYNKGVAAFGNGDECIYFHYDSRNGFSKSETGYDIVSRLGSKEIKNTVSVGIGIPTKLSVIRTNSDILIYLLANQDVSGLTGPTHMVIGKRPDGSYVEYFNTRLLKRKYFSQPRDFHFAEQIIINKDTIIIPYKNLSDRNKPKGEFRFKWDDKAQWFGVEKVVY